MRKKARTSLFCKFMAGLAVVWSLHGQAGGEADSLTETLRSAFFPGGGEQGVLEASEDAKRVCDAWKDEIRQRLGSGLLLATCGTPQVSRLWLAQGARSAS